MTIKDFLKGKSICIIGAHTDDIELGMGGTLYQIQDLGPYIITLSTGYEGAGATPDEYYSSMNTLGYDLPELARGFSTRNFEVQQVRDLIFNQKHYDVFFTHSTHSMHRDHRIVAEAVYDIMKEKTIICWEEIHSGKDIPINMWNEISAGDMIQKTHALDCYKSQAKRPYFEGDHISTLARYRGNQILKSYAEAFNVVRLVL